MKRRAFLGRVSLFGIPLVGSSLARGQVVATGSADHAQSAAEHVAGIEPVNYSHPPGNVRRYGAVGDGKTDDSAAIQRAVNASRRVYFPPGDYLVRTKIDLHSGSCLIGEAAATLFTDGLNYILSAIGTLGPRQPVRLDVRRGTSSFAAAAASGASYERSGGFLLQSDDSPLGHASHRAGEIGIVANVDGDDISAPVGILGDYRFEANAMAAPVRFVRGISISGLALRNTNYIGNPTRVTSPLIYLEFVEGFRIASNDLRENNSAAVSVFNCLNGVISNNTIGHLTDAGYGLLGYGIQIGFSSQNISILGNAFTRCRHAVTTGTGTRSSRTPNYGVSRALAIVGNSVSQCTNSGLDTHEDSDGVTISGNSIIGCSAAGIHIRSYRSTITGNTITSCLGKGIRIARTALDTVISANVIRGIRRRSRDGDGIVVDGAAVTVAANRISECDRHGIAVERNALQDININGNTCKNNGVALGGDGININRRGPLPGLLVVGNICTDDQTAATQRHHISIEGGTVLSPTDSLLANNLLSRSKSEVFSNRGSGSPRMIGNTFQPAVTAKAVRSTAPSAADGPLFLIGEGERISFISDGIVGQTIRLLATGSATITQGPRLRLDRSLDFNMRPGETVTLTMFEDHVWLETGRSRTAAQS